MDCMKWNQHWEFQNNISKCVCAQQLVCSSQMATNPTPCNFLLWWCDEKHISWHKEIHNYSSLKKKSVWKVEKYQKTVKFWHWFQTIKFSTVTKEKLLFKKDTVLTEIEKTQTRIHKYKVLVHDKPEAILLQKKECEWTTKEWRETKRNKLELKLMPFVQAKEWRYIYKKTGQHIYSIYGRVKKK